MDRGRTEEDQAEDDLPLYLARQPRKTEQVPRQSHRGLFCTVEDAFENKTIDFDALSSGQKKHRTPRITTGRSGHEEKSDTGAGEDSPRGNRDVPQSLGEETVRKQKLCCFDLQQVNLTDLVKTPRNKCFHVSVQIKNRIEFDAERQGQKQVLLYCKCRIMRDV